MIRKLTAHDIATIKGMTVKGYAIENARFKGGTFIDSDNYGIVLGRSPEGYYVTWQFHYDDGELSIYWGHYHMENQKAAVQDFNIRA